MPGMRRREFVGLFGGAAAAWPVAARAQQSAMPVIGFLRTTPSAPFAHIVTSFRRGLSEVGFIEGQNVAIEQRWTEGENDRLPALVADLIRRKTTVIVTNYPGALASKAATTTIPIVFATGSDPVRDGLVASLNRPGGNLTGVVFITSPLGAKRLELLRQLAPKATTVAMLVNPNTGETEAERTDVQNAAQALGQDLVVFDVTSTRDIEAAFARFVERGAGGLLVGTGPYLTSVREQIVALAARHGVPAMYTLREFVSIGGLVSYGSSISDAYRQAGMYAGRILKGENPADLPVMQSTKFEFLLNLRTAKTLGLEVPDKLLALADEVIE
jgi:putative tryptophan/tyrosine transport system substrate-binding protein